MIYLWPRGGHVTGVPQSVIRTIFIIDHSHIEERPRVCLSSALYNYISRHDKYSVTTHCQVVRKVLQVSNIVFV